jgi:cell wall-associated NlpC family hydrolase
VLAIVDRRVGGGRCAENFSSHGAAGDDAIVQTRSLVLLAMLGAQITACGASEYGRSLPRDALIARAWAGREPPPTEEGSRAVAFASAQLGKRYCWGGMGPGCFDCSGLAGAAWRYAGTPVPRTAQEIVEALPEVPLDEVRAGDILWWPGHVGIYAGRGWVIDALDSNHGVVIRPAATPYRALRPIERRFANAVSRNEVTR